MAAETKRNITIFINGKEVENSMKAIARETAIANAEFRKAEAGTEKYNKAAQKIVELRAAMRQHNDDLKALQTSWDNAGKTAPGIFSQIGTSLKGMAGEFAVGGLIVGGITAAIAGIKSFFSESSEAFQASETAAKKLEFAVVNVGKEGADAFQLLNNQASDLMGYFDDETIRDAQTALINYGLTSEKVYSIMPLLMDTAAQSGRDLQSITTAVIKGIEGQGKGLKDLGLYVSSTATETENYNSLLEQMEKFQGGTANALGTTTGQLKAQQIQLEEAEEQAGKYTSKLSLLWSNIKQAGMGVLSFFGQWKQQGLLEDQIKEEQKLIAARKANYTELLTLAKANGLTTKAQIEEYIKGFSSVSELVDVITRWRVEQKLLSDQNDETTLTVDELDAKIKKLTTSIQNNKLAGKDTAADLITLRSLQAQKKAVDDLTDAQKTNTKETKEVKAAVYTETEKKINAYKLENALINDAQSEVTKYNNAQIAYLTTLEKLNAEKAKGTITEAEYTDQLAVATQELANATSEWETFMLTGMTATDGVSASVTALATDAVPQLTAEMQKLNTEWDNLTDAEKFTLLKEGVGEAFSAISNIVSFDMDNQASAVEASYDRQLAALEKLHDSQRISDEKFAAEKAKLDAKKEEEQKRLRKQQAVMDRAQAIFSATTAMYEAIVKATTAGPIIGQILAGITAAFDAIYIAKLIGTPIPEFYEGGFTDGDRIYRAGERGKKEYIAPGWQVESPVTGPIIDDLDRMRRGKAPRYISDMPARPAFSTLSSVTSGGGTFNSSATGGGSASYGADKMDILIKQNAQLIGYLTNPQNRRVNLVRDELTRFDGETDLINSLAQIK